MDMAREIYANPEERGVFLEMLRKDGHVENFQAQLKRKDGSLWWASTNAQYYRDADGKVLGVEGVTRDVTELRLAREKKEKLESQLIQAQKMESIGTLAGGIAHDFNNILSGIYGFTEMAKAYADNPVKLNENLDQIANCAHKAAALVQQILTFSRKSKRDKIPLEISVIAREALRLIRSSLPSTIEIRENIRSNGTVLADPTKLHQIMMNLCTNAYHAMQEHGGVLTVNLDDVEVLAPDDIDELNMVPGRYVCLAVIDTGHGMDRGTQDKIFEPYFTTKEMDKGTGLGLAVVLGIVKEHKGYIKVKSAVNAGTTFFIYLPVTDKPAGPAVSAGPATVDVSGNETILIVDDEKDILSVSKAFLEHYGYRVFTFADGIQALEAFEKEPDLFDLVVTDMTMPRITGDRLAKRIMKLRPGIPVFLCTGFSDKITQKEALALGIRQYLEKPVVLADLVVSIRRCLDKKNQ